MKPFLMRHRKILVFNFIFATIGGLTKALAQFLIRDITDGIALNNFARVPLLVAFALGLHVICIGFSIGGHWVQNTLARRFAAKIRVQLFNHLAGVSQLELEKLRTGDLQSAFRNDTDQASEAVYLFAIFPHFILLLIFETIFLATIHLPLTLIVFSAALGVGFVSQHFLKAIKRYETASRKDLGDMSQSVLNIYDSADTIKMNSAQGFVSRLFNIRRDSFNQNKLGSAWSDTIRLVLQVVLNNVALFGCVIYLSHQAIHGYATIGEVLAYTSLLTMLLAHIDNLFRRFAPLMAALAGWERVKKLLGLPVAHTQANVVNLTTYENIDISNIHFAYREDAPIFQGFSLHLKKGFVHALTGGSGSGKTTLIKILLGFYEAPGIKVEKDGAEMPPALSGLAGYVPSDNRLFNMSIYENITLGDHRITKVQCMELAESIGFSHWIASLPEGLDTPLVENARNLSGGQAQGICILRALATNRPILVMDEPFAALDPDKERALLATLAKVKQERIVLLTSHRVSSVDGCDRTIAL